ncbi:U3 small nucleolar RNA-associated protein 10, partial [Dissostichus eleginoides]
TNKCRKTNFTVVGGWKRHQQFQSSVSQLWVLRLDVDPKVCQAFLSESRPQCPIRCDVHKAVNLSRWELGTDVFDVCFVPKWIPDPLKACI